MDSLAGKRNLKSVTVAVAIACLMLTGCGGGGSQPSADSPPLADTVWAQVESNFPDGISPTSPLFVVTDVEDVSTGTIRVLVQENLSDEGREEIARHVFNMGAMTNDDLTTVVVRDASGSDSNHRR